MQVALKFTLSFLWLGLAFWLELLPKGPVISVPVLHRGAALMRPYPGLLKPIEDKQDFFAVYNRLWPLPDLPVPDFDGANSQRQKE